MVSYWVRIPGSDEFVVGPKNFEGDGYQLFQQEMTAKGLVRPFWFARVAPFALVIRLRVIVPYFSNSGKYIKGGEYCEEGLWVMDLRLPRLYKTITYQKRPRFSRYFLPVLHLRRFRFGADG